MYLPDQHLHERAFEDAGRHLASQWGPLQRRGLVSDWICIFPSEGYSLGYNTKLVDGRENMQTRQRVGITSASEAQVGEG